MKKTKRIFVGLLHFAIICIIFGNLVSCFSIEPSIKAEFDGERILRKMTTASDRKISGHSSFFLFSGSSSFQSQEDAQVFFAWKMNSGEYQISSVSMTKVRVKFDEEADVPKIMFVFPEGKSYANQQNINGPYNGVQEFLDSYLVRLKIIVKESDWQPAIKLPFNDNQAIQSAETAGKATL
jgi:hypothetical protein